MSENLEIPSGVRPVDLADDHLEIFWWDDWDSSVKRTGRLLVELFALVLGLQPESGVQPRGIDVRWRTGGVLASCEYGDDRELAQRHIALLQHRLGTYSVERFIAALATDAASARHSGTFRTATLASGQPAPCPPWAPQPPEPAK
ncbi:hypothetical protein ACWDG1_41200 [Streptomyces sp. NPDC001177]